MIRTGIVLPIFRESPHDAFEAARLAFAAGVDGVFCFDHIWPMGQPDRPSLAPFPVLAALAASAGAPRTADGGPFFGTLVARVGLVPNQVLLSQFTALENLAPGRIIAGLGTGDRLSQPENRAYGIPYPPAAERRTEMVTLARALRGRVQHVWLAGGPRARIQEARTAEAALNLWDADPALVASRATGPDALEVTWAGPPPKGAARLVRTVRALVDAGATWAIFAWPVDPDALVAAAAASRAPGPDGATEAARGSGGPRNGP